MLQVKRELLQAMNMLSILVPFMREVLASQRTGRVPEPSAVMDEPTEVASYTSAGRELGIMAPTYLFHTAQACQIILPGDRVLDLACGPATQLAQLAMLNPDAEFVGVDLSREMLSIAKQYIDEQGLRNVTLAEADVTDLSGFADDSFAAVVSSMSLHHLPDLSLLDMALREVSRLLRPDGGIYLADFGRLKSPKSMRTFAYRDADLQPESFARDYFNSLRAAFSVTEFRDAVGRSALPARVYRMYPIPFMMAAKSKPRRALEPELSSQLRAIRGSLSPQATADLANIISCFRLGKLATQFLAKSLPKGGWQSKLR